MENSTQNTQTISVETIINAPIERIWECWTEPAHICEWAHASDDWCVPRATNDVRIGGEFMTRMESTDGVHGFDFTGTYTDVLPRQLLAYAMSDGRKVSITFEKINDTGSQETYKVTETFDPEHENSIDMQRAGWQAILDNFKKHVEKH